MKEVIYKFDNSGCYLPDKTTLFDDQLHIRLIIEPHQFELKISDEVLRSSYCKGYIIEVSHQGEVCFYDYENNLLAKVDESQKKFTEVRFSWEQDLLSLSFGHEETVDNYPNCDGEHDRWSTAWISEYNAFLNTATNQAETSLSK